MKTLYKTFLIMVFFAATTACDKDLVEINENPNEPEIVPTNTIFNSATKELMDISRNAFSSGRMTLPWVQYWAQTSYADEDRYAYRESGAENFYIDNYEVANDLKAIIDLNTNPETKEKMSTFGNNQNQIAASRIMLSYIFHQLVDTFGDIPYYSYGSADPDFQALNVNNILSPVFASQEKIYEDILKELRAAADNIVIGQPVFISGDNVLGGDAAKWKKFANSLILRVANRLRQVDPNTANAAINAAVNSGVFTSNADNAIQKYEQADATGSPFFRAFYVDNRTDFAVAAPFLNLLKGSTGGFGTDPRLFEVAAPSKATIASVKSQSYKDIDENALSTGNLADYEGIPYGFPQVNLMPNTEYSYPSFNILKQDYGEVLMEYAEVAFILAEHNGWDQTFYEAGVRASMERWGIATADIDTFVAGLPAASEENVLTQKYVGLYMQPYEAWAEYRRTGYPNTLVLPGDSETLPTAQTASLPAGTAGTYTFTPIIIGVTDLPARLKYPVILQTLNGNNRDAAVSQLTGGDLITSKLFWDVN